MSLLIAFYTQIRNSDPAAMINTVQEWVGLSRGGVGICSQFGPYRGRDLTLITILSEPSGIAQGFIDNFLCIHVFSFVPWNKLLPKKTSLTTIAAIGFSLCFDSI